MKIAIDCGHALTGADIGASGNGYKEEKLTREVGIDLEKILKSEGNETKFVHVDNVSDVNSSLAARVNQANSWGADLFVSIHFNSGGGTGTETYIVGNGGKSEEYAKRVNAKLVEYGYKNRGVKVKGFYVLRKTNMPAILIEVCFIDSVSDMQKFNARAIAKVIAEAIENKAISDIPIVPSKPNDNENLEELNPGCLCTTKNINTILNLRTIGSLSGHIIAEIKAGDNFIYNYVDSSYLGWLNVTYKNKTGYVNAEYVQKEFSASNNKIKYGVVTASTLNVRSIASTSSKIIGKVYKDEKVEIKWTEIGWYYIIYDTTKGKKEGYVSAEYVKEI